ncbi:hypothetical protein KI387_025140 [Taxus chinensis]|uniref:STAS domain-containing protein n=1 Tax=Taxus chinensis TaxID=29808 RepID=A0AA38G7J8_TAXCH|nr:hypothetical protein KI387_025140 [Taxus chinensis]
MNTTNVSGHVNGLSDIVQNDLEMSSLHKVSVRPPESMMHSIKDSVKETFFPDDPFKQFKNQPRKRKLLLGVRYIFPILEWAPRYSFKFFRSDLIADSSFVPPLVYAILGSSRDIAIGGVAITSLILASALEKEVSHTQNPELYLHLALSATFLAGIFQAIMGIFRLGFIIDFLSHATLIGFMAGAAVVVSLQQLKGFLGLKEFTKKTDIVSVMRSVWKQTDKWKWETIVIGIAFLCFLLITRHISKKKPKLFWISAAAPLTTIIIGTLLVLSTHLEKHGVQIIGNLKSGLNPVTVNDLVLNGKHLKAIIKIGLIISIITITEGVAIGRTFALIKKYHIDGNKEMIAMGMMNMIGPCFSCYMTTGIFSRTAVNFNAGCKTAVSNIVMSIAVMLTLLFLTSLFHYTPLVALSSIITSAMLGLIDIQGAHHLWKVDKVDFLVAMAAFVGVVFGNIEIGLAVAVTISVLRVILHVSRPHTAVLGNIPNTTIYRNTEQYPDAKRVPGILILRIDGPIYFSNSSYLRERIMRWIDDEEERKDNGNTSQYVILDMAPVTTIDTSGIKMLEELKRTVEIKGLQLVLSNPGSDLMEKLQKARLIEILGENWIFLTISEAVKVCCSLLNSRKLNGEMNIDNDDQGGG